MEEIAKVDPNLMNPDKENAQNPNLLNPNQPLQPTQKKEEEARRQSEAEEKVSDWCKANGFQDMYTAKKTLRGATKLPMHTAVKHQNDEMVQLLLKCGADKEAEDSKKQTPMQLAEKKSK